MIGQVRQVFLAILFIHQLLLSSAAVKSHKELKAIAKKYPSVENKLKECIKNKYPDFKLETVIEKYSFLEDNVDALFANFKKNHNKHYPNAELEETRKALFKTSLNKADGLNLVNLCNKLGTAFGVTKFSDYTSDELKSRYGLAKDQVLGLTINSGGVKKPTITATSTTIINWVDQGKVTPVKNQGQCGSCWAFSATEAIESAWAMAGNAIWELSPQEVISCTPSCYGCGGGLSYLAFEYLMTTKTPLASAWYAPYSQSMFETCLSPSCTQSCASINTTNILPTEHFSGPAVQVTNYSFATPPCYESKIGKCVDDNYQADMTLLANNVLSYGPVSIAVNAANWDLYTGGVLSAAACGSSSSKALDHGVLLVGFNAKPADGSAPYWIVKNQWATNWGENGYIYLEYPGNTCGLGNQAVIPSVA